ncbi:MAG: ParB/RepB/Spo0J family partition protein [Candidatus Buchananbacteria bacterium]|nr:ParB/RepB/Spo0J family partition protein [Candidatus Buchananbacteria bacterium]
MLSRRQQKLEKKEGKRRKQAQLREARRARNEARQPDEPSNGNAGTVAPSVPAPKAVQSPVLAAATVSKTEPVPVVSVSSEPHWMERVVLANPKTAEVGQVVYVDPQRVQKDPKQPRKSFDPATIAQLAQSIYDDGQEEPAQVYQAIGVPNTDWILKNGERRWRACKLKKLPFLVLVKPEPRSELRKRLEQTLSNGNREDLSPPDDAQNIQDLLDLGCSMEKICETYNRSEPWIYQRLALLKLDPAVLAMMSLSVPENERLGPAVGYEISSAPRHMQFGLAQETKGMKITHARRAIRAKLGKDRDPLDKNRNRKPSDDRRVLDAFLARTADDAVAFSDFGQEVFDRMFAFMSPADLELTKQRVTRAINNLRLVEKLINGIKMPDAVKAS